MAIDVFLMGDSHIGSLRHGAREVGIETAGGITVPFGYMFRNALRHDPQDGFLFQEVPDFAYAYPVSFFEEHFRKELERAGYSRIKDIDIPLIANIGCNPAGIVSSLSGFSFSLTSQKRFIAKSVVREMLLEKFANQIAIVRWLHENLPRTCFVSPPIGRGYSREMWIFCQRVLFETYAGFGATTYSPVPWACLPNANGGIRPEYLTGAVRKGHKDMVHGNSKFGARMWHDCMPLLGMTLPAEAA